jgi:alpha-glucosidase (family GH31 glycosyl hydrolase)
MEKEGRIDDISESDIGIHIINHPFSFYLYRKDTKERLFDTTISEQSKNFDHYLYYAKNYIQISSCLPKNHFSYGLGERFSSLRLKHGKYVLWAQDPLISLNNQPLSEASNESFYSSIPYLLTINPDSLTAWGSVVLNSSPIEANLDKDFITYKLTSGVFEMIVFAGPRPKDVVLQMHQTLGTPFLQSFSNLNWHANVLTNDPLRDLVFVNSAVNSNFESVLDQEIERIKAKNETVSVEIDAAHLHESYNVLKNLEVYFDSKNKYSSKRRNIFNYT